MSAPNRRGVGELLAASDELARETLLDATPDHEPGHREELEPARRVSGRTARGLPFDAFKVLTG